MPTRQRVLKTVRVSDVTMFKIRNRQGYAAICLRNLTEGRTPADAFNPAIEPRPWPGAPLAVRHSVRGRDVRPTRGVGAGATDLPVWLHRLRYPLRRIGFGPSGPSACGALE